MKELRHWWRKDRWYRRGLRPFARWRLGLELARHNSYARGPLLGEPLTLLREGRLTLGPEVMFEPWVWITAGETGRIAIGGGTFVNVGAMIAAAQRVEIGEHCMLANGVVVTDSDHRFDDPTRPVPWQGFAVKGPTIIGDNVWLGAHAVVTSGVTIGRRSVIGANSTVTGDIPAYAIAVGSPARVVGSTERGAAP